jgi:ABC-type transport system involved in multi-copper enzyme maturation permease subunit
MIISDMRRVFFSRSFLIGFSITLIALAYGMYDYARDFFPLSEVALANGADPFTFNTYDAILWSRLNLMGLLAPLVVALPFADSVLSDRVSGYQYSILLRTPRLKYIFSKVTVTILSSIIVLVLPQIIMYFIASLIFPQGLMDYSQYGQMRLPVTGSFSAVYQSQPWLYIWFVIGLSAMFGAAYASLGLFVSCFTNNRYVVLAAPFMLYTTANFLIATFGGLEQWLPTVTFLVLQIGNPNWLIILGELLAILTISSVGVIVFLKLQLRDV